jgi:ABC-type transporter MlaC component
MKAKTFDCIRMKREAAQSLLQNLETLTAEERARFWEEAYQNLLKKQREQAITDTVNRK